MTKKQERPNILLINFDQKTANNVQKTTGVEVVRGFIGNHDHYVLSGVSGKQEMVFRFETPTPPYECAMVFINLDNYADSEKEFGNGKEWSKTDTENLGRFWQWRGTLLVFFAGETSVGSMLPFGVPVGLEKSSGIDKQTNIRVDEDNEHLDVVIAIEEQVVMPTTKYIRLLDESTYYGMGMRAHTLINNKNGDRLAVGMSKSNDDYHGDDLGVLILPQVKQQSTIISKLTKRFADHYGVQLADDGWLESDNFYPQHQLQSLKDEIQTIIDDARKGVDDRQKKIADIKTNYAYLKDLLTSQGDTLVDAVYETLTEVVGLIVTKSDETNGSNPKEDLLIEYNGNILVEVKGTKRQNPSLKYPQQAMQHALRQGLAGLSATGLILNHDKDNDPSVRTLAYSDKESKSLITDIYFIDTRVLHAIALAVLDGKQTKEKAAEALFGKLGRAEFTQPSNDVKQLV